MLHLLRRSLLVQLLGGYLLFVVAVLAIDFQVNAVVQQQVTNQVQTTDLALGQEIAQETHARLDGARTALVRLGRLPAVRRGETGAMRAPFQAFQATGEGIDLVYWLDPRGVLQVSFPTDIRTLGETLSSQPAFRQARAERGPPHPVLQPAIVDLTTFHAVVALAVPVRDPGGRLLGVLATNLGLNDLSDLFQPVIASEQQVHQQILFSIVDEQGRLIGTVQRERLLQPVLDELPGAAAALAGHTATRQGTDPQGKSWLYSAVPVPSVGWAVVVQRSTADALAPINNFRVWITVAAGLFALGGLLFWLVLMRRVVQPLRLLARRHAALPMGGEAGEARPPAPVRRTDEIGGLARSLARLERDVVAQLAELHTLLETSSAVVTSLDPIAVGHTIIREVQRLVDIQAAAVFVPDEGGVLRVLVSEGRVEWHDEASRIQPDDLTRPTALALHDGRPVQMIAGEDEDFPPLSLAAGFRAILAVPIVSRHVGGVVLAVHRTRAQPFTEQEIDLLLTFANHATLAWEHAVLYERSDERLREVARENERLYREAMAEKQTLTAIMRSMSDGLILTGVEGTILYANPGAAAMAGLAPDMLEGAHIDRVHESLRRLAADPAAYDRSLARVRSGDLKTWLLETEATGQYRAISLRLFDVRDDDHRVIGRGLLLRDVTREREVDRFKTTLLGAVGHELRTPLAVIKGYASTLLQEDVSWSAGDERHFLRTISAEADRLAELVSNLLDLSRLEAGLLLLRRTPGRLEDLVASAIRRVPVPPSDIVVDIPAGLPLLDVDRARLEVVLHNLLSNAIAYGNGQVHIAAQHHDGSVLVHVSDNGPGIPSDELTHIFERFYRARHGSQRRSSGTGLGLAICKAFVEVHGGTIWAESSERGTTISFSLPASAAAAPQGAPVGDDLARPVGRG
ncbi:MAG: GAF domain-containing protein [Chloroflexi bacterium]|nr:GAF domain-containing protein [Chloroflexota bacterium]